MLKQERCTCKSLDKALIKEAGLSLFMELVLMFIQPFHSSHAEREVMRRSAWLEGW